MLFHSQIPGLVLQTTATEREQRTAWSPAASSPDKPFDGKTPLPALSQGITWELTDEDAQVRRTRVYAARSPEGAGGAGGRRRRGRYLSERAQLHDDPDGVLCDDSDQLHDVRVVKLAHRYWGTEAHGQPCESISVSRRPAQVGRKAF